MKTNFKNPPPIKCPVCKGKGRVGPPWKKRDCGSCGGTGELK